MTSWTCRANLYAKPPHFISLFNQGFRGMNKARKWTRNDIESFLMLGLLVALVVIIAVEAVYR